MRLATTRVWTPITRRGREDPHTYHCDDHWTAVSIRLSPTSNHRERAVFPASCPMTARHFGVTLRESELEAEGGELMNTDAEFPDTLVVSRKDEDANDNA